MGPPAGRAGAFLRARPRVPEAAPRPPRARLRARRRRAGPGRRSATGFEEKLLGVLSDKDSWDYATALFNSANQLRDRGDYEGAASKIRRGLKEVIEGDALLALVRAENHLSLIHI